MPLYHFVTNDLPANTRAVQLSDTNATRALKMDAEWTGKDYSKGSVVTEDNVGKYLTFLCSIGFIPNPTGNGKGLPEIPLTQSQMAAQKRLGGRGKASLPSSVP